MRITAEVIASWPPPNHVNPETRGPAAVIVGLLFLGLAGVVLTIRLYARLRLSRGFGQDDVLICFAYAPATAFVVLQAIGHFKLDADRHTWDVRLELVMLSLQVGLVEQILFALATGLTKLSVLALVYRVVDCSTGRTKHVVLVLSGIVSLDTTVFVFVTIFQCSPISDSWTVSSGPQNCLDQGLHLVVASIINTVQDFLIVFVPVKTVLGFDLPLSQRLTVLVLFAGGLVVCIAGSVRTYFTWVMVTSPDGDITWRLYDTMFPSAVELFLGIICASAPATKPFFTRYFPLRKSFRKAPPESSDRKSVSSFFATTQNQPSPYSSMEPRPASHLPPDLNKPLPSSPQESDAPGDLHIISLGQVAIPGAYPPGGGS
ncbi:hypothetical protein QBC40DRAFT_339826 [Triangularia verruculosa]|uniref:Rhodopsin domain-containing protein n=1 Tax=Triangularia verruculosa TaxID=2587418 RepID=A0AAN6XJ03_9PEZI|nr:hypothetical protein QBC40DRAFT_339826 [Triangularia verruculosa]